MQRGHIILTSGVAFVCVVAGVALWRSRGDDTPRAAGEAQAAADSSALSTSKDVALRKAFADAAYVVKERTALVEAVETATTVYTSGTVEDFKRWLEAQGLSIPEPLSSPDEAKEYWRRTTQSTAGAKLDWTGARVLVRVRNGQSLDVFSHGGSTVASMRRERGAGDVDPEATRTDVVEVQVPAILRSTAGKRFTGRFCMTFARRPSDGQWIIISTAIRDFPAGERVFSPPL